MQTKFLIRVFHTIVGIFSMSLKIIVIHYKKIDLGKLFIFSEPRTVVVTNTHLQTTASPIAAADMQAFPPSYPSAMNVKGQVI